MTILCTYRHVSHSCRSAFYNKILMAGKFNLSLAISHHLTLGANLIKDITLGVTTYQIHKISRKQMRRFFNFFYFTEIFEVNLIVKKKITTNVFFFFFFFFRPLTIFILSIFVKQLQVRKENKKSKVRPFKESYQMEKLFGKECC